MATKRVTGLVVRQAGAGRSVFTGRVLLSPETADVFRGLARYLGISLDELAQAMIVDFVPRHAPGLELVMGPDDPGDVPADVLPKRATVPEQRVADRRDPASKGAKKPLPPAAERRRKQRRS